MPPISHRALGVFLAIAAAAALGVAIASEVWGQLIPCALCLVERWPYRLVIALGIVAAIAPPRIGRLLIGLAILCLLADAAIAFVHVGVEHAWWPSPLPECAAPHIGGGSLADRLASMPARPSKPCDEPTYLIPGVPLSMAGMNMLFALGLALLSAVLLRRQTSRPALA
jgi:disulfide bond formation protein DsbB